jgi:sugar-phosphatase
MRAVIFDMDGVIVDSEPLWREAEMEVFAGVGLDLSEADCERTMGMRTDEVTAFWYDHCPWPDPSPQVVEERIHARMLELIAERAEAIPGLEHALAVARASGLTIGLASSSSMELIDAVLSKLDLEDAFKAVCSATREAFGKPHPAVFITAARLLNVAPSSCTAIEDSVAGVRSALAAGMRVVAVPPEHLWADPGYDGAHFKLRSLTDFTAGVLLG